MLVWMFPFCCINCRYDGVVNSKLLPCVCRTCILAITPLCSVWVLAITPLCGLGAVHGAADCFKEASILLL